MSDMASESFHQLTLSLYIWRIRVMVSLLKMDPKITTYSSIILSQVLYFYPHLSRMVNLTQLVVITSTSLHRIGSATSITSSLVMLLQDQLVYVGGRKQRKVDQGVAFSKELNPLDLLAPSETTSHIHAKRQVS